jgi:hypothetical protein
MKPRIQTAIIGSMSIQPTSKPSTSEAMCNLIAEIRRRIPFDHIDPDTCSEQCNGCSLKLIEYLNAEIEDWEYRLEQNEIPNFRDLQRLEKSGRKIYRVLCKNGVIGCREGESTAG